MKTRVYIDGFNFYYRVFKSGRVDPRYKWMNPHQLAQLLAPNDDIEWIGYFTANVKGSKSDPNQPVRQRMYFAALATVPIIEIVYGNFREVVKKGIEWDEINRRVIGPLRTVKTREEKGSDVNLAIHLVVDACQGNFERAIVLSNDADLAKAIKMSVGRFNRQVDMVSPAEFIADQLKGLATSNTILDLSLVEASRFPDRVTHPTRKKNRTVACPPEWM